MPSRCQLTGKGPQSGHNVAHSNVKTNRRFAPNLQRVSLHSDALKRDVSLRICTRALRTVQKKGGLDAYLVSTDDARLAETGLRLKRKVRRALQGATRTASA